MAEMIIDARSTMISSGLEVKRILPFRQRRMVGPFIFLDHAGPTKPAPQLLPELDVLPHPHIGLSTITYLLEGKVTHRDSLGVEQIISPGEVNWMTAGKGISHSERFEDPSFLLQSSLQMLQLWVALPEQVEEMDPTFTNFSAKELPVVTDKGIWMRVIAGDAYGFRSNVHTFSPLFYIHAVIDAKAQFTLPEQYSERAVYVVSGTIEVGAQKYGGGKMLVYGKNEQPIFTALEKTVVMLLGGEPLGKRYIWWNFVSSRKERIEQAKQDWETGKIILPPNDNKEFIPLPADWSKPSEPPEAPLLS